jgi:uncharacterized protein YgiM (DUF1202 family)
MEYISPEVKDVLYRKLKTNEQEPRVKVTVDKLTFLPDAVTEIDIIKYLNVGSVARGTTTNPKSATVDNPTGTVKQEQVYPICPIKGKTISQVRITSNFGPRDSHGGKISSYHHGLDIGVPTGTDVVAAADGTVIVSQKGTELGHQIAILHVNGFVTRYGHLYNRFVGVGDVVKRGQVIAKSDNTGTATTGPHLHFEIRTGGTRTSLGTTVDPLPYLQGKKSFGSVTSSTLNTTGVVNASTLNIRSGPGTNYSVKTQVHAGDILQIISQSGSWYKVRTTSGVDGYASMQYVSVGPNYVKGGSDGAPPGYRVVETFTGNITAYTAGYESTGKRPGDPGYGITASGAPVQELRTVAMSSHWPFGTKLMIDYPAFEGVIFECQDRGGAIDQRNEVDVYIPKLSDALQFGRRNLTVKILAVDNSTVNKSKGSTTGSSTIPVYGGPSTSDSVIENLQSGVTVDIIGAKNGFYKVVTPSNKIGYISSSNLQGVSGDLPGMHQYGIVIANSLNLRSGPDTSYSVIGGLSKNDRVEIITETNGWYLVELIDGRVGYVSKEYIHVGDVVIQASTNRQIVNETFENYIVGTIPEYDEINGWIVRNNKGNNILFASGGDVGDNYAFSIEVYMERAGKISFKYLLQHTTGHLDFYVDNVRKLHESRSMDNFKIVTFDVPAGSHVFRWVRTKTASGSQDKVMIDNISCIEIVGGVLDETDPTKIMNDSSVSKVGVIVNNDVKIYSAANENSSVVATPEVGDTFEILSRTGSWYKVVVSSNVIGYVLYDDIQLMSAYTTLKRTLRAGGFEYARTLEIEDVISVDIDRQVDMGVAEATVVIADPQGVYAPDYTFWNFPEYALKRSPFVEYYDGKPFGVLSYNTPIRIDIGYGDKLYRRFTGVINNVEVDRENGTITLHCLDRYKFLNEYLLYTDLSYPPETGLTSNVPWLCSAVVQDIAIKGGLTNWRRAFEDLIKPDLLIEETYYIDVDPVSGTAVKFNADGDIVDVPLSSVSTINGWKNPYVIENRTFKAGTTLADALGEICNETNSIAYCDRYGTFVFTSLYNLHPIVAKFTDEKNILTLSKDIDLSRIRNHIVVSDGFYDEHFFDEDLWNEAKGQRKTAVVLSPWAVDYGMKKAIADKIFFDIKCLLHSVSLSIEGDPTLDVLDRVDIYDVYSTTRDTFTIKGIRDSFTKDGGYINFIDVTW